MDFFIGRTLSKTRILSACCLIIISISTIHSNILDKCSISQSRLARSILNEIIFPLFKYTGVAMNELCPFHPKHDIYAIHEQMKNKISDYDWECQMCGKRFYTENTFDLHIGNRHETNAYSTSRTICLSSYCSLLRCSVLKPDIDYGYQVFWDEALCDPKSFEAISKQCEDILNKCTPSGNDSSSTQIRQLLQTTLCDQLSCDRYWILPDSHIQTSVWEKVLTAFIVTAGLLTYYSVIFMRLSSSFCRLRISSLSIPRSSKKAFRSNY
ncbi:unnamed protein product [Schistosoma margrebowiei]|uniref:C2H2-type domain-containing protein n=2 Tax=Schistosoma margrebowiei TaxID=48269 RepID=A0AA85AHL6_9TREM|nr:unnamed protein product [Schistosoma margrebowiei]